MERGLTADNAYPIVTVSAPQDGIEGWSETGSLGQVPESGTSFSFVPIRSTQSAKREIQIPRRTSAVWRSAAVVSDKMHTCSFCTCEQPCSRAGKGTGGAQDSNVDINRCSAATVSRLSLSSVRRLLTSQSRKTTLADP